MFITEIKERGKNSRTLTCFNFLGRVSWGPNLWGNAQYPHIWKQQRIRRFTFVRFKRLRLVLGGRPIGRRGRRRRRQACETDPREKAYNARRTRTWSANCVQGLIMWKENVREWFILCVSQALWDASRMKEMRLILAIAWLFVCFLVCFFSSYVGDGKTVGVYGEILTWSESSGDGWRFVYMKTCCVHY